MHYRTPTGSIDRLALAIDSAMYQVLFDAVDQAQRFASSYAKAASDPEVSAALSNLAEALCDAQFKHLVDGARLIIEAAQDEAASCGG